MSRARKSQLHRDAEARTQTGTCPGQDDARVAVRQRCAYGLLRAGRALPLPARHVRPRDDRRGGGGGRAGLRLRAGRYRADPGALSPGDGRVLSGPRRACARAPEGQAARPTPDGATTRHRDLRLPAVAEPDRQARGGHRPGLGRALFRRDVPPIGRRAGHCAGHHATPGGGRDPFRRDARRSTTHWSIRSRRLRRSRTASWRMW